MITVYKYGEGVVNMPKGAIVRKAAMQNGRVTLWAEVDTSQPLEARTFVTYGTGWEIDEEKRCYIDTIFDGPFVWHVYEVYNG